VVITGGAGFIGQHCARHLLEQGWDVHILDLVELEKMQNLAEHGCTVQQGDIRSASDVHFALDGADAVVHLAALISVPQSFNDPEATSQTNVEGTRILLKAAQAFGVQRVIAASSAAIYGESEQLPVTENNPVQCQSPYAESKFSNEIDIQQFREQGLNAIALRFFNVYGPNTDTSEGYASVLPIFVDRISKKQPLIVHGDGLQTRDFVHVADVALAISNLLDLNETFAHGVVNVATGKAVSLLDVIGLLNKFNSELDRSSATNPRFEASRVGDIRHSVGSYDRLHEMCGWEPTVAFETGLRDMFDRMIQGVDSG